MIRPVVKIPDPILRKKAQPVAKIDEAILRLVEDMKDTMYKEPGVGLAAPQIGVSLRVIVWDSPENKEGFQSLINPKIVKTEGQEKGLEGCLSIPDMSGEVVRYTSIQVEGIRPNGANVSLALTDFTARILQHEVDHIDGILYIDRLSPADRALVQKKLKKLHKVAPSL